MYIIVECPDHIIRGEQVGIRVTVFNYWFGDEFIEVSSLFKCRFPHSTGLVAEFFS
jgi:hypothetical protein